MSGKRGVNNSLSEIEWEINNVGIHMWEFYSPCVSPLHIISHSFYVDGKLT